MRLPRLVLVRNPISLAGAVLVTVSAVVFFILYLIELLGYFRNPYAGLLVFVAVPAVFVLGLLLIPIGMIWERRRPGAAFEGARRWPLIDLNDPMQRRMTLFVAAATLANSLILSIASYGAVHYMESPSFCGQTCHRPMEPEFTAYQTGPHSRVGCVACHVGAGATYFARAKLSGTRQMLAVMRGNYRKPIPSPVHTLRPARDTCEECHWPDKFYGDQIRIVREYANDKANSESVTTVRVHVGGGSDRMGVATGIHWHMNLANEIEYIALDEQRQKIPYVRLKDSQGNVREYVAEGVTQEQLARGERRRMDCMDCHSRPSHTFEASAERAVDAAIATGRISRSLPFVRREAVKALTAEYPSQEAAQRGLEQALQQFFGGQPAADATAVRRAIASTQEIYGHNIFPSMKVKWGTYSNELGHIDFPGCFRCHDDSHKAKDGKAVRQDCDLCHEITN